MARPWDPCRKGGGPTQPAGCEEYPITREADPKAPEDEPGEEVAEFFVSCAAVGTSSLLALVEPNSERERAIRAAFVASLAVR